ncbi:MAG: signal peptidase I [Acetatifactor sp.]|nr:signal peptidase I [Acetatifactor sp.]
MKKKKILKEFLNTGLYLLFVLAATWALVTFVVQRTEVDGSSMESTLSDGDNLFVDKISYRFRDPERFDIIVFPFQYKEDTYYIKRIIGLPGETVQIDTSGNIYIDGEVLRESYGREVIKPEMVGRAAQPVVLGEDEYFVMGDNRNNSSDSRTEVVGNIHRNDIVGRAWVRIWPLNKLSVLKHQ